MFTGIVEEVGRVQAASGGRLVVTARTAGHDVRPGDSMAVDGVCLTAVDVERGRDEVTLTFDLSPETLDRTALAAAGPGSDVNLERPVTLLTRLGGHLVQGHVDGVGVVTAVEEGEGATVVEIETPAELARYLVPKGSVAVAGVSLTVASVDGARFRVALVPYTLAATTLGRVRSGARLNLEVDVMAKYVEALIREGR